MAIPNCRTRIFDVQYRQNSKVDGSPCSVSMVVSPPSNLAGHPSVSHYTIELSTFPDTNSYNQDKQQDQRLHRILAVLVRQR